MLMWLFFKLYVLLLNTSIWVFFCFPFKKFYFYLNFDIIGFVFLLLFKEVVGSCPPSSTLPIHSKGFDPSWGHHPPTAFSALKGFIYKVMSLCKCVVCIMGMFIKKILSKCKYTPPPQPKKSFMFPIQKLKIIITMKIYMRKIL